MAASTKFLVAVLKNSITGSSSNGDGLVSGVVQLCDYLAANLPGGPDHGDFHAVTTFLRMLMAEAQRRTLRQPQSAPETVLGDCAVICGPLSEPPSLAGQAGAPSGNYLALRRSHIQDYRHTMAVVVASRTISYLS